MNDHHDRDGPTEGLGTPTLITPTEMGHLLLWRVL